MNNLISEILNLPIIIQGALGSFLFWLFHICTKKILQLIDKEIKRDKKEGKELTSILSNAIKKGDVNNASLILLGMLLTSLGFIVRFMIVTIIGYLIKPIIPVFGYLGFIIGIYYLLKASTYLPLNPNE